MITYEFFLSISPLAPDSDVWVFWNVEITANSLSRSNYFNFFMIFFDAFIMILYDSERSKYVMVVKKQKRKLITLPESKQKVLRFAWIGMAFFGICTLISYLFYFFVKASGIPYYVLQTFAASLMVCYMCNAAVIFLNSSNTETRKHVLRKLLCERRVIFICMLLGVLFYVDGIYMRKRFGGDGFVFCIHLASRDLIVYYDGFYQRFVPTQRDAGPLDPHVTILNFSNHTPYVYGEGLQSAHVCMGYTWPKSIILRCPKIDVSKHFFLVDSSCLANYAAT